MTQFCVLGGKISTGNSCDESDVCADSNAECMNGRCTCRTGYGLDNDRICGMKLSSSFFVTSDLYF